MAWLKFFYDAAQKGARAQRVTMPMFNAFWQQNKLIEMRRSEKNEQYVRYGDFRADPVKMRWVRQAAKLRFTPKRWKNLAIRIARHTQPACA
ncbi:hypothetical protein FA041_13870 [Escherichia coli]|nr:hypothetical protein [Escherichia coli]